MPLSRIQIDVLQLLASHRNPESYVAGSTPLNREKTRYSADIDIFHDREERVARAAEQDGALLQTNGYALEWQRRGHWPASSEITAAMFERYKPTGPKG